MLRQNLSFQVFALDQTAFVSVSIYDKNCRAVKYALNKKIETKT